VNKWQTDPRAGLWVGIALIALLLVVMGGLVTWAITNPVSLWTFLIGLAVLIGLGVIGLVGYWLSGLVRSSYELDRNALTINWGASEHVVPTGEIKTVLAGEEMDRRIRFQGIRWHGHWVGTGRIEDLGQAVFCATAPPKRQVFVVTEGLTYCISPEDREGFLRTLESRLQMGPTQSVEATSRRPGFLKWPLWRDWFSLALLGLGVVSVLGLVGFLSARYLSLPLLLPLHFDAYGNPDRLGARGQIFFLPLIGLIVLLVNDSLGLLLYRRERLAAHLLWASSVFTMALLWAAVLGILAYI